MMPCVVCGQGKMQPGETTVVLRDNETTVVLKGVPAEVCDSCGEYYLSEETAHAVLTLVKEAVARGAEVEILRYAA